MCIHVYIAGYMLVGPTVAQKVYMCMYVFSQKVTRKREFLKFTLTLAMTLPVFIF